LIIHKVLLCLSKEEVTQTSRHQIFDREAHATNMGFAKMGADGSRVSTFVFQFGFISSLTLLI
jgi:hypothetical protein